MKEQGVCLIVGKTIERVIVKRHKEDWIRPAVQVFLIFTDGTSYEIYSADGIGLPSGLDKGGREEVLRYLSNEMEVTCEGFLDENKEIVCVRK